MERTEPAIRALFLLFAGETCCVMERRYEYDLENTERVPEMATDHSHCWNDHLDRSQFIPINSKQSERFVMSLFSFREIYIALYETKYINQLYKRRLKL